MIRSKMSAVQSKLRAIQSELLHLPPAITAASTNTTSMYSSNVGVYHSQTQAPRIPHSTVYSHHNSNSSTQSDEVLSALVVPLRELLLHSIPYHRTISHYISENSTATPMYTACTSVPHTLPLYTEKLDWMMHNLYNTSQLYSSVAGRNNPEIGSSTELLQTTRQVEDGLVEDIISEFD